jgi:hypothetical protein
MKLLSALFVLSASVSQAFVVPAPSFGLSKVFMAEGPETDFDGRSSLSFFLLPSEIECAAANSQLAVFLLSSCFSPPAYTAPVERRIAVDNVVRREDQGTLDHEIELDDECYTGKDGTAADDCVDFDPPHA